MILHKNDLANAIKIISREKGVDQSVVIDILKTSFIAVCRKNFGLAQNIDVHINEDNGAVQVVAFKKVKEVDDVEDERLEISVDKARKIDMNYNVGDTAEVVITPKDFGRVAAQTAKQIVSQKFLELERDTLYNKFIDKKDSIIVGVVRCAEPSNFMISLGDIEVILPEREQVPGEKFKVDDRIKLYVFDVRRHPKGVRVLVSRANPNFIRCLFEREIPEVSSGIIRVVDIARDPGKRSKVAVFSHDGEIDAIGSCVGENGNRISTILAEIKNEKIDLVKWHESAEDYIRSALNPAKISYIRLNDEQTEALVVVTKEQVSLAIGRGGQNVKLAARLIGIHLDVKTPEQLGENFDYGLDCDINGSKDSSEVCDTEEIKHDPENDFTTDPNSYVDRGKNNSSYNDDYVIDHDDAYDYDNDTDDGLEGE